MLSSSFSEFVLYLAVYGILGFVVESLWFRIRQKKWANRGLLSGPYCMTYGLGAVIVLVISALVQENPVAVFLAASIIGLLIGWSSRRMAAAIFQFQRHEERAENRYLDGRVWWLNAIVYGILGLVAVYFIQPYIVKLFAMLHTQTHRVLGSLILSLLVLDTFNLLYQLAGLQHRIRNLSAYILQLQDMDHPFAWMDASDIIGSLRRLRAIHDADTTPEEREILRNIDQIAGYKQKSMRLMNAYPELMPRENQIGYSVLREVWQGQTTDEQKRVDAFFAHHLELVRQEIKQSYQHITASHLVWVFLIGSVIGYVVETLACLVNTGVIESRQGMIYGPFNQIYGFGAVLMVLFLSPLARKKTWVLFLGSMIIGGAFEVGASFLQEIIFGTISWEYSQEFLPLFGGRTSLKFLCFWGILGTVYMRWINPRINQLIFLIPKRAKHVFTWVIVVVLSANMLLSAAAVYRWTARRNEIPAGNVVEVFLDQQYPNAMLEEIYPNMKGKDERETFHDARRKDEEGSEQEPDETAESGPGH